ncbi:MAG TPA: carbohydrate ABC transporter permease [Chthoniobacterales bacterium]
MRKGLFFRRGWHLTLLSAGLLFLFLVPLFWMVSTALKPTSDIYADPPKLIPLQPDWTIWGRILADPQISRFFVNSVIVACGTTVVTLSLAVPCAYGLAHLRIRGKAFLLGLSLGSLMFPAIMIATPLYITFGRLGILNTYPALILADTAVSLPFAIVMLRPSFRSVPKALAEAAQIDGCGRFKTFWFIVLPLVVPGILTAAIFTFLAGWGDLLMALTLTTDDSMKPVTAGLFSFIGNNVAQWNRVMALATLQSLPPLFLFLMAQRYVVSGLTDAAVKQ